MICEKSLALFEAVLGPGSMGTLKSRSNCAKLGQGTIQRKITKFHGYLDTHEPHLDKYGGTHLANERESTKNRVGIGQQLERQCRIRYNLIMEMK